MNRLIPALLLVVLLPGCGVKEKKESGKQFPTAAELFDKKAAPIQGPDKAANPK